jgi:hypothetical protein
MIPNYKNEINFVLYFTVTYGVFYDELIAAVIIVLALSKFT